jgi:hypothetical protein
MICKYLLWCALLHLYFHLYIVASMFVEISRGPWLHCRPASSSCELISVASAECWHNLLWTCIIHAVYDDIVSDMYRSNEILVPLLSIASSLYDGLFHLWTLSTYATPNWSKWLNFELTVKNEKSHIIRSQGRLCRHAGSVRFWSRQVERNLAGR